MRRADSRFFLVLFPCVAVFSAAGASASTTGSLALEGNSRFDVSLTVQPNGSNPATLNILAGEVARNIASVLETSNNPHGYRIQMSSSNGGRLQRTGAAFTTYQVSYDGSAYVAPSSTPFTVKNVTSISSGRTDTSPVLINVTAYPNASAGTYSDVITFTILANP